LPIALLSIALLSIPLLSVPLLPLSITLLLSIAPLLPLSIAPLLLSIASWVIGSILALRLLDWLCENVLERVEQLIFINFPIKIFIHSLKHIDSFLLAESSRIIEHGKELVIEVRQFICIKIA